MKRNDKSIKCIAFVFEKYEIYFRCPHMEEATSAIKAVYDEKCPFLFRFDNPGGTISYCVVCSRKPNKVETERIKAIAVKRFRGNGRTPLFVVG